MYEYTWYQWLAFFYIYCFFGWIFESVYVSFKERRPVNRGFLRLPLLPLYGTGAVMMLWVSLPVKDHLGLVYLAGVAAATALEYVTGWGMERLFKMKYWDYSGKRFNVKGYICLSSSAAWGFLTILLTEVLHRPVEAFVLGLSQAAELAAVGVLSLFFAADAVQSVRAALDLAKVLEAVNAMRRELEEMQVQMALLRQETGQRMEEARESALVRLEGVKADASARAARLREGSEERLTEAAERTARGLEFLREYAAERKAALSEKAAGAAERADEWRGQMARIEELGRLQERMEGLGRKALEIREMLRKRR